jgi:predicted CoA-binding protein
VAEKIAHAAAEFLAHRRIAVTGVSRHPQGMGSNVVYKRLRDRGYRVFAVNPNADEVEGDPAYPSLIAIPGRVEAVVIGTRPEQALATMRECVELGIHEVWMHAPAFGAGSVSSEAAAFGRLHGVHVIDGGCPCMFGPAADVGHRILRHVPGGHVPKTVEHAPAPTP